MPVAVVSDAHLGGPGGPAGPLVSQLDELDGATCERLLIMGDLFQVWVGNPRFETGEIRELASALERLRDRGVETHYIEGNRDFFLADSPYAGLFETVGSQFSFTCGERSFLAVHGDGINKKDYLYRFWRRLSKNPISRLAMYHLPHALAARLIHGFESELAKTNFKHKRQLPTKVIVDYARRRLAGSTETILLGHFHEPFRCRVENGEVVVFDAWFRSRRIDWIDEVEGVRWIDDCA